MNGPADVSGKGSSRRSSKRSSRRSSRRIAVLITVQSALLAACLAAVFYVYYLVQQRGPEGKNIYIQFHPISGVLDDDEPMRFHDYTSNMMMLGQDRSQISVGCDGPHIVHLEVCVGLLDQEDSWGTGTLTLRVNNQPRVSFPLNVTRKMDVGRVGQQQMVYLRRGEVATLHFRSRKLRVRELTLGLHYLLGVCLF